MLILYLKLFLALLLFIVLAVADAVMLVALIFISPWSLTRQELLPTIVELAKLKPQQVAYDLGCGDGRVANALATSGAQVVGFEHMFLPWLLAWLQTKLKRGRAQIKYQDFFRQDLGQADVLYCYLTPYLMPRLAEKISREGKKGALVISLAYALPGYQPSRIVKVSTEALPLFVYLLK
jgi:hypothetical protein